MNRKTIDSGISSGCFVQLMTFLIDHNEDREPLFRNPEFYEQRIELVLSEEDKLTLKRISSMNSIKRKKLNEKLVLCSASGA